ncbi:mitochondrial 39-S ribosomal protein L47 (MRP-L47)-domain-containing protein [Lentinula boryana]|uniref:Large ribosomal subunit protein uL29m n=1 Tax=Lentinula boryana TaxID=40481 RepID=A0ABQ8QB00_9AGAR|nr:mitochondrial 39-S ribosomal protein L47 (MRP-L47)-domain-containing protein [Lentinula boryana]
MLTLLRRSYSSRPRLLTRSFAEVVPVTSQPSAPQPLKGTIDPPPTHAIASPDGNNSASNAEPKIVAPERLGNRVPVRADHGLYAFFRLKEPAAGQTLKGEAQYETLGGSIEMDRTRSSRAWKASELRLKSFQDLHILWYILLRERNLLATQEEEVRRLGATKVVMAFNTQVRACRKSMARIKYVMNERRLAYEGALKLAEEEKTAHITNLVLKQQLAEHQKERELFRRQKRARIRAAREAKRKAEQARKEVHITAVQSEVQSSVKQQDIVTAGPDSIDNKIDAPEAAPLHPQSIKTGTAQSAQTIEKPEQTPKARSSPAESASEAATAGLFGTRGRRR